MRCAKYKICGLIVWVFLWGQAGAADLLTLRQEYNQVSAEIDSLVRAMQVMDAEMVDGLKLPEGRKQSIVPEGLSLVMIFWADDEAQVWVNDFLVGETRLTPVEVSVPDLYLRGQNTIRARCWDTDWVESGFLCGLYLKDGRGKLHPVVVSNGNWKSAEGRAMEITYAHPSPNIPGAEPIWGPRVFGAVELSVAFDQGSVKKAVHKAVTGVPSQTTEHPMQYHDFVQQLSLLQARRENLKTSFQAAEAAGFDIPIFDGTGGRSAGLTLGKAGALKEEVSAPVAERVRNWSQELPVVQQHLIYPDQRALKGENTANITDGGAVPLSGDRGKRQDDYKPPEERGSNKPGTGKEERGKGAVGSSTLEGEGQAKTSANGFAGGFDGGNRRSARLGLLLPTLILGLYVVYVATHWQTVTGQHEEK